MALLETEQMEPEALAQAAFGRLAAIATMGEPTLEPSELVRLISLLADAVLGLVVGTVALNSDPAPFEQDTTPGYL